MTFENAAVLFYFLFHINVTLHGQTYHCVVEGSLQIDIVCVHLAGKPEPDRV